MGHWQKVQYGKSITVIKLPEKYEGKDEIILIEKGKFENDTDSPHNILRKHIQDIENSKDLSLKVPDRISSRPDTLIRSTIDYYEALKRYYNKEKLVQRGWFHSQLKL